MRHTGILLVLLAAACTGPVAAPIPSSSTTASPSPSPVPDGGPAIAVQVVAATSGTEAEQDRSYLEGMQLAVADVNAAGGIGGRPIALELHDDQGATGTATDVMQTILAQRPAAVLYVGPGAALSPVRESFEQTDTPVILLEGDLYTSRGLFPQLFQTTIPWEWQAKARALGSRSGLSCRNCGTMPPFANALRCWLSVRVYP